MKRCATALAILVALLACVPVPAEARTAQQDTGSVTLVRQSTFRAPDEPFTVTLHVRSSSAEATEVAVSAYRRLRTRSEFALAVDGTLPTRTPTDLAHHRLDTLPADGSGNVTVSLEPRSTRDGVYPIRVELRQADDGTVLDSFTTFVVTLPATVEADPLSVALVLPLHAPPSIQPDGQVEIGRDHVRGVTDIATGLARRPEVPLSLLPTAETLEALADGRSPDTGGDIAASFGRVLAGRQVIATTYVPVDMRALLDAGLGGELNAQLERSRTVVQRVWGTVPGGDLRVLDERLDAAALGALESQDVTRLVVPGDHLTTIRPPHDVTLTARFEIAARGGSFDAAAADPGLTAHFTRDVPPALAAAHLLADLAVLWLDRPGRGVDRRGVVALGARSWEPSAAFVDTLLDGLSGNPVLEPVTLDGFFRSVGSVTSRRGTLTRTFLPPATNTGLNASVIRGARRDLEAFASTVAADNETLDDLDRRLLVSESSQLRPTVRTRYARQVSAAVTEHFAAVAMPERRSITLTAREGELPVTVTNRLPFPVRVLVTLQSDALDFPGGATREVELTHENTTERFEVHARGSGSFPVRVRVAAPNGDVLIAESRFTVRSTAVSGVGVALSVGATLFLVVWWASHLHGRRSSRRAAAAG